MSSDGSEDEQVQSKEMVKKTSKNLQKKARKKKSKGEASISERVKYGWRHGTVKPVYFFFLLAYMLQTSLVKYYLEDDLAERFHVEICRRNFSHASNESADGEIHAKTSHEERAKRHSIEESKSEQPLNAKLCEEFLESYEHRISHWHIILLVIYAGPTLVLAPLLGSWTDGLHRIIPMYVCVLGMTISSLLIGITMTLQLSSESVVYSSLPSGLSGGAVLFTIAVYSYEAEKYSNFAIFESYLTLQCVYVGAKTVCQFLIYIFKTAYLRPFLIWGPLGFSFIACIGLIKHRLHDKRPINFTFCHFTFIRSPKDFVSLFRFQLSAYHYMLVVCAFVYYFAYVGETGEIMKTLNDKEPWQVASFAIYGAVQGVSESVGLVIMLYFWKRVIHKKFIDGELLPHFSIFVLCILGYVSDMLTKVIVCITPVSSVQYWESLIGVVSELAIVVIRYFMVLLVPKRDVGKVLSLVAMAQILSTVPAAFTAQSIYTATSSWWSNFVYLFLALLQLIPIGLILLIMKFVRLPDVDVRENEEEEGDTEMKPFNDNEASSPALT